MGRNEKSSSIFGALIESPVFQSVWAYGLFSGLVLLTFWFSYSPERGGFSYSLDDPYIHLALAENILQGHYGINLSEFSSPSSSILWPILLAPFANYSLAPLLLNILLTLANLRLLLLILGGVFGIAGKNPGFLRHIVALLLLLGFNGIGLAFTGMEHVLHTFLTLSILYGLMLFQEKQEAPYWLWVVIMANPLVRYEGMAFSGLALVYIMFRGKHKSALIAGLLTALPMLLFSYFLYGNGQGILPSSLSAKSNITSLYQISDSYFTTILHNIASPGGLVSVVLMGLAIRALFKAEVSREQKALLLLLSLAGVAHLIGGRYGWYGRYEIYIGLSLAVLLVSVYADWLQRQFTKPVKIWRPVLLCFILFLAAAQYIVYSISTPIASHNISDQQAQMGRFVRDYWQDKVAVNDLGLVSYKNDKYVLDLFGLGSVKALRLRKENQPGWMAQMTHEKNVKLALIYDQIFPGSVPLSWTPVAELSFTGLKITPAFRTVKFYATEPEAKLQVQKAVVKFKASIPGTVRVKML